MPEASGSEVADESDYSIFENKTGLAEDMKFLASMPELCDVTFLVGDTKEPICAVKAVLAARSRVFQKMFYQAPSPQRKKEPPPRENKLRMFLKRSSEPLLNLQNAAQQRSGFAQQLAPIQEPNLHHNVIIEEFEPDVFRQLIEYIHTGCVTLQPRTLLGLMNAADFYGLDQLRKACTGFVQCCITVDTVCALLASAERYIQYKCTKSLVQKVMEFVDEHGNEVLNLGSFTLLPQHVVGLILGREELRADEFTKFQAVLMWSKKYCDNNQTQSLKDVIGNFLEYIQFHKIPANVLMREVHPLGLVPSGIIVNALAYQADPTSVDPGKLSPHRVKRQDRSLQSSLKETYGSNTSLSSTVSDEGSDEKQHSGKYGTAEQETAEQWPNERRTSGKREEDEDLQRLIEQRSQFQSMRQEEESQRLQEEELTRRQEEALRKQEMQEEFEKRQNELKKRQSEESRKQQEEEKEEEEEEWKKKEEERESKKHKKEEDEKKQEGEEVKRQRLEDWKEEGKLTKKEQILEQLQREYSKKQKQKQKQEKDSGMIQYEIDSWKQQQKKDLGTLQREMDSKKQKLEKDLGAIQYGIDAQEQGKDLGTLQKEEDSKKQQHEIATMVDHQQEEEFQRQQQKDIIEQQQKEDFVEQPKKEKLQKQEQTEDSYLLQQQEDKSVIRQDEQKKEMQVEKQEKQRPEPEMERQELQQQKSVQQVEMSELEEKQQVETDVKEKQKDVEKPLAPQREEKSQQMDQFKDEQELRKKQMEEEQRRIREQRKMQLHLQELKAQWTLQQDLIFQKQEEALQRQVDERRQEEQLEDQQFQQLQLQLEGEKPDEEKRPERQATEQRKSRKRKKDRVEIRVEEVETPKQEQQIQETAPAEGVTGLYIRLVVKQEGRANLVWLFKTHKF